MIIRPEIPSDTEAITRITVAAFKDCPYGSHTEQFIITSLRAAGTLTLSLVAEGIKGVTKELKVSDMLCREAL